ncbi:MAG: hypothetical protein HYZ28_06565 [Myxococcales bacterium]|nr:hypothetical protein [Myxococcales bacterium]
MPRSYSMRGVMPAAARAVSLARAHLLHTEPGGRIHDVQEDPRFQHRGVDLLWERSSGAVVGVEVKGDRQGRRGNYFLELISNLEKDTPGCFLYSVADLLLYVFLERREVHELPLAKLREWFLQRAKQFPLKATRTRTGKSCYTTVGAVVPVRKVLAEVPGAIRHRPAHSLPAQETGLSTVGQEVGVRRPSSTRRAR